MTLEERVKLLEEKVKTIENKIRLQIEENNI